MLLLEAKYHANLCASFRARDRNSVRCSEHHNCSQQPTYATLRHYSELYRSIAEIAGKDSSSSKNGVLTKFKAASLAGGVEATGQSTTRRCRPSHSPDSTYETIQPRAIRPEVRFAGHSGADSSRLP